MEILTIAVLGFVSFLIVPLLLIICTDTKDADAEPKPKSFRKKSSKEDLFRLPSKSNGSTKRKSKAVDKEDVTVIANGSARATYEEVAEIPVHATGSTGSGKKAPKSLSPHPKQVNDALTNGAPPGARTSTASNVNETSPASSQRSSRASSGQPRVVSLERALPEIPNQTVRHSLKSERSPSTKRALPELPSDGGDDGAGHYDQLERDLPPHQIKSKTSSDSSSVKVKTRLVIDENPDKEELIEPDEITRNSVFVTPNSAELYASVSDENPDQPTTEPSTNSRLKPLEMTKSKAKVQYSKVKKHTAGSDKDLKSPSSPSVKMSQSTEPVYSVAPPVPVKMYDVNAETAGGAAGRAAAVGAIEVVVDDNAQDSGSGYYAVTDNGPAPNIVVISPHADLPESYDILTARESIASVRARQVAGYGTEEDYYESMDDKPVTNGAGDASGTELYAEIDNPSTAASASRSTASPVNPQSAAKEELYAEIDSPHSSTSRLNVAGASSATSRLFSRSQLSDSGYERVDFNGPKGEQTDSAGYAIVKELGGTAAPSSRSVDDEEDYAECEPLPGARVAAVPAAVINEQITRHGSNVSDYATVSYNDQDDAQGDASAPVPPAPQPVAQNNPITGRRYQREHLYQEICEVRPEKDGSDDKKK